MTSDEHGSTLPLIIGFATVVLLVIAFAVDASAAYLQHSRLQTLADGAALAAADAGATGAELYMQGVTSAPLTVQSAPALAAVGEYLAQHPSRWPVTSTTSIAGGKRAQVRLRAPLHLPLGIPGVLRDQTIAATANAEVLPDLSD